MPSPQDDFLPAGLYFTTKVLSRPFTRCFLLGNKIICFFFFGQWFWGESRKINTLSPGAVLSGSGAAAAETQLDSVFGAVDLT